MTKTLRLHGSRQGNEADVVANYRIPLPHVGGHDAGESASGLWPDHPVKRQFMGSPSPRPSPQGRGRIVVSRSANRAWLELVQHARGCSLPMNLALVATSRCDVPARVPAGGTVAPLNAARTARRAVPTRFRGSMREVSPRRNLSLNRSAGRRHGVFQDRCGTTPCRRPALRGFGSRTAGAQKVRAVLSVRARDRVRGNRIPSRTSLQAQSCPPTTPRARRGPG